MNKLSAGIDEAGRGPVIGPMIMGCVVLDEDGKSELRALKVRDSKKIAAKKRAILEPKIKEIAVEWKLVTVSASEIDRMRKQHSLNMIEAMKIAQMITELKNMPSKILVDAADSVAENYTQRIIECITRGNEEFRLPEIISEHKADDKYVEVGAASILAKVMRDREIEKLKEIYGEIGSGYPADELTKKFIQKASRENNFPECVRLSWNTVSKSKQTSLFEF